MMTRFLGVFLLLSCSPAFADDAKVEPPAEAQKALAALKEWRAALHSVSLTFEMAEPGERKKIVEWDWSEDGSLRENTFREGDAEHAATRSARLFTAGKLYLMGYPAGDSHYWRPDSVKIDHPISGSSELIVAPLFGLWGTRSCKWVPDELSTGTEWLATAGGHPVALVTPQLRVEFASEHGYLPVDAASHPRGGFRNVVQDFETAESGILFPKRGIFITSLKDPSDGSSRREQRWEMVSIRINDPATADNFKPPIPDGTQILNTLGKPLYVQGVGLNHAQPVVRPHVTPAARPSVWNRTTGLMVALGVLLVVGGISWFRRPVA
jgi:hypothetical protein